MNEYEACRRFVEWLDSTVIRAARGDDLMQLDVEPSGRLWLGRIAPEEAAVNRGMGDRGERLDPCAIGIVVLPSEPSQSFVAKVHLRAWVREQKGAWKKTALVTAEVKVRTTGVGSATHGATEIASSMAALGVDGLRAEVRTEVTMNAAGQMELAVQLVNTSPEDHPKLKDTNLYECALEVVGLATKPFLLESLPDSFRYDRRVPAYGINCGVVLAHGAFKTTDSVAVDRGRPRYWSLPDTPPDLSFQTLARDPFPSLNALIAALRSWGAEAWSSAHVEQRAHAEKWSQGMIEEARRGAEDFAEELRRVEAGLTLLRDDQQLLRAFCLMNDAIQRSSKGRYDGWRPFQVGFLLANVSCLVRADESEVADIVWFATGGGKTETYLGIVVTAAFYDRLRGKRSGITAWNRFPLRMLSLQQTQRFADALAAAELVRREQAIVGDPFSIGFLVGQAATPNRISPSPKDGEPDPDNIDGQYKILLHCPFCHGANIDTAFDHGTWQLQHICKSASCVGGKGALPFYIVDEEIYRFLPTVIVGTLDKAATISMQASMRGFVGAPWGKCTKAGHGFTYAPRSNRKTGCLVPDCRGTAGTLDQDGALYAPTLRLQDELHLLKDSLGAVDAHYEALVDHLQLQLSGRRAKILGSSATLSGYEKQVDVLYKRRGRVFPAPGPSATDGFWTSESELLARRFVALAPRGVTVEYAVDRSITELQQAVRQLCSHPKAVCEQAGIDPRFADTLISLYGVEVVYGNTLRDLDAVVRSFETQIRVGGPLRTASLTGRTEFDEVRSTLERLDKPEDQFDDRLHLIAASAMMSHGVDIDRLNVMVIMGLPLTTAEFIQTSARVGRRYPGLVFVMPKMARERDASVFRSFVHFVQQGDRLVEPIAIGRRSRRVLERTLPGLALARVLHVHEPNSATSLTLIARLRDYFANAGISANSEKDAIIDALGFTASMEAELREDIESWFEDFFSNLRTPPTNAKFPSELSPTDPPMMSLRDVEEQAPIFGVSK
jgi:hypothetical protein